MMRRRRGVSLLEIAAAAVLLAVLLTVCLRFMRATTAQRRGLQARRAAVQEVANVMERLAARSWEELTPGAAGQARLSAEAQRALPNGRLEIEVAQTDQDPDAKRITVVLRWPAGPEQPDRSVRLVAWRYPVGGR